MNTSHLQSKWAKLKFYDANSSSDIPYVGYNTSVPTSFIFLPWYITFHHCTKYQHFIFISQQCVFSLVLAIELVQSNRLQVPLNCWVHTVCFTVAWVSLSNHNDEDFIVTTKHVLSILTLPHLNWEVLLSEKTVMIALRWRNSE